MNIQNLTLENFRNIKAPLTFEFQNGINLIVGDNGKGKSSVLKALRLLLLDITDSKLEDYVNELSESFSIAIEFDHAGNEYKATMKFMRKGSKTERTLYVNDFETPTFNTTSAVKEKLAELFDPHVSKFAMVFMQNSKEILTAKPAERLELFKKVRNINYTSQAAELNAEKDQIISTDIKNLDIQIGTLQGKEYNTIEEKFLSNTESEIAEFRTQIDTLTKSVLLHATLLEQRKDREGVIAKAVHDSNNDEMIITGTELEISVNKDGIRALDGTHASFVSANTLRIKTLNQEKVELELGTDSQFSEGITKIQTDIANTQKELSTLEIRRIKTEDFSQQLVEHATYVSEKKSDVQVLEKKYDDLKNGVCPTCGTDFLPDDIDSIVSEIAKEKDDLQTRQEAYTKLTIDKKAYDEKLVENQKAIDRRTKLNSDIELAEQSIQRIQDRRTAKMDSIQSDIEKAETEFTHQQKILDTKVKALNDKIENDTQTISTKKAEIITLQTQVVEVQKALESMGEVTDITEDSTKLKNLTEKVTIYNALVVKINQAKEFNKNLLEQKIIDKADLLELQTQLEQKQKEVKYLEEARNILLKTFPNYVIQESIADTEASMNNFIETTYDKPLDISLRSTATSLKMEYGVKRKRDCSNLSGAEEVLTSLSFIDSLNREVGLNFMALDEVDQTLSHSNSRKLFDIISKMEYSQLLIITHNEVMQSALLEDGAKLFNFVDNGVVE